MHSKIDKKGDKNPKEGTQYLISAQEYGKYVLRMLINVQS